MSKRRKNSAEFAVVRRLQSRQGASLAETMFGFLIVILTLTILAQATLSVNRSLISSRSLQKKSDQALMTYETGGGEEAERIGNVSLQFTGSDGSFTLKTGLYAAQTDGSGAGTGIYSHIYTLGKGDSDE